MVIPDPITIMLVSSESLRLFAESTDEVTKLKIFLFQLADEFDRVRKLMPTSQCVELAADVPALLHLAPPSIVPPPREQFG
jgi:hypothetical protein